jgi:hypothetical protein
VTVVGPLAKLKQGYFIAQVLVFLQSILENEILKKGNVMAVIQFAGEWMSDKECGSFVLVHDVFIYPCSTGV